MILNREQILQARDRTHTVVSVPEWGGDVCVAVMSGNDRDKFDQWVSNAAKTGNYVGFRAFVVAATAVDEEGQLLFAPDDLAALGEKASPALIRVYDEAMRINHITDKDREDLEKNSESGPGAASSSGSP